MVGEADNDNIEGRASATETLKAGAIPVEAMLTKVLVRRGETPARITEILEEERLRFRETVANAAAAGAIGPEFDDELADLMANTEAERNAKLEVAAAMLQDARH